MREAPSQPARKHGLTLVEVCLVLALLVVIGAISAPLLENSFSRAELHGAGDLLRGAWSRARLAAMESGQTYVFRFEPNGSRFQITTLSEFESLGGEASPVVASTTVYEPEDILRLPQDRLPEGIVFAAGDIAASTQVMAKLGTTGANIWSSPILFQADGTTSDASIVLGNEIGQTMRVTLRGLTGISNVAEIGREAAGP